MSSRQEGSRPEVGASTWAWMAYSGELEMAIQELRDELEEADRRIRILEQISPFVLVREVDDR